MPSKAIIQHRRDSAAQWTSLNPALAEGEIGYESDTAKFKIGRRTAFTSATSSIATSSGTVTITLATSLPTNVLLQVGDTIVVEGVTPNGYNGTHVLTAVTSNTVSFTNATTGSQTIAGTVAASPLMRWNNTLLSYQGALSSVTLPLRLNDGALSLNIGSGLTTSGSSPNTAIVADFGVEGSTKVLSADHNTSTGVHGLTGAVVGTTDAQELSNKTFANFVEKINVVSAAPTSSTTINVATASIWYFTSPATVNYGLNFTGISSALTVNGQSITVTVMHTNGVSSAFYPTSFAIQGTTVTPKWQVSAVPEAGDIGSINSYSFTILRTAANTYTVFASQTRFD